MKKIISLLLVLTLAVTVFAACGTTEAPSGPDTDSTPATSTDGESVAEESSTDAAATTNNVLNLYSWEGVFPQEVFDGFTAETGVEVNFSSYDLGETMLAKLEADTTGAYDLVLADDYIIQGAIAGGFAQKLDLTKLPNISNINPVYQGLFYDENNEYSVPYAAGVMTIVYDPTMIELDIKGYKDLWDPSLVDTIGIIGNYRVVNGMALKILGESYNTDDTAKIAEAGQLLNQLAPNIRVIKDDNLQNDIITGEIGAGIMYTSQVTMALMANPDLKVVYPAEGIGFGMMASFIPEDSQNVEGALAFLEYILRPEVAAQCIQFVGYYSVNSAADEFIAEEFKAMLTLPAEVDLSNMEMIQSVSPEADEAHSQVWTEFKAGL